MKKLFLQVAILILFIFFSYLIMSTISKYNDQEYLINEGMVAIPGGSWDQSSFDEFT